MDLGKILSLLTKRKASDNLHWSHRSIERTLDLVQVLVLVTTLFTASAQLYEKAISPIPEVRAPSSKRRRGNKG